MTRRALAWLALGVALMAGPAQATQEYILPTRFDVAGVAAGDVLNIRSGPGTGFPVIGSFAHDATGIEVVAHDATGRWGRVNTGERSGWSALRFLAYRTDVWKEGELPDGLRCLGTEPFWSFAQNGAGLVLATPEEEVALPTPTILSSGVFRHPRRAVVAGEVTAVIVPQACSDGMSDRAYGLDATLLRGERMLTGCCTLGQ